MRTFFLVFLVVTAAVASLDKGSCLEKNAFYPSMQNSSLFSVEIWARVARVRNARQCGNEWIQHGTCCDPLDLEGLIELENKMIDLNHQYLSDSVLKAAKLIGEQDQFKSFPDQSSECWTFMKKMRSSALCSICSGRSEAFFHSDKALIAEDTCKGAATACDAFFRAISDISKMFKSTDVFQARRSLSKGDFAELTQLAKDLKAYSPPQDLIDAFEEKVANELMAVPTTSNSVKICSKIMNIRKKPYILVMNSEGLKIFTDTAKRFIDLKEESIIKSLDEEANKKIKKLDTECRAEEKKGKKEKSTSSKKSDSGSDKGKKTDKGGKSGKEKSQSSKNNSKRESKGSGKSGSKKSGKSGSKKSGKSSSKKSKGSKSKGKKKDKKKSKTQKEKKKLVGSIKVFISLSWRQLLEKRKEITDQFAHRQILARNQALERRQRLFTTAHHLHKNWHKARHLIPEDLINSNALLESPRNSNGKFFETETDSMVLLSSPMNGRLPAYNATSSIVFYGSPRNRPMNMSLTFP